MEEDGIEVCEGGEESAVSCNVAVCHRAVTGHKWIISKSKPKHTSRVTIDHRNFLTSVVLRIEHVRRRKCFNIRSCRRQIMIRHLTIDTQVTCGRHTSHPAQQGLDLFRRNNISCIYSDFWLTHVRSITQNCSKLQIHSLY